MKIIVEGCDAVGKDTFINNISKLTKIPVTRGSSFEISNGGADAMFKHSKAILYGKERVLVNRFFYSNLVYGALYDYPMMEENQYKKLNDIVNRRAIVYYLTADTDVIAERMNERGDDMISSDDVEKIKDEYLKVWLKYKPVNLVVIDVTNEDLLDINSKIYSSVVNHIMNMEYIRDTFLEED